MVPAIADFHETTKKPKGQEPNRIFTISMNMPEPDVRNSFCNL